MARRMCIHLAILACIVLSVDAYVLPPASLSRTLCVRSRREPGSSRVMIAAAAPYAPWAHSHWVWLSSGGGRSNQTSVVQFAKEFLMRNISVGAVDVDSGWATGFNNFVPDTTKVRAAVAVVLASCRRLRDWTVAISASSRTWGA